MNLADPELELIDPTPNIHSLFTHFDELFFYSALIGRALVRWSKRMYSCAGVCSYEGRNGLCDIALSEPLLKLRPRKNLVETLLHEMIHAYLFITNRDNDRDGHGPNFQAHMHRINRAAGLNISIYHDFHDEVKLYLRHWWRCNGKCQKIRPYFGIVRRSVNRPPGPNDRWWASHQRICGGTFVKIKEPEIHQKPNKKTIKNKVNADITKYINNNDNTTNKNATKPLNMENKTLNNVSVNMKATITTASPVNILKRTDRRTGSVIEKVRDVWINKHIPAIVTPNTKVPNKSSNLVISKHKADSVHVESPPRKIKKIDDYFKTKASKILKDVYGDDFILTQSNNNGKLNAVIVKQSSIGNKDHVRDYLVSCPSCNLKVSNQDINRHLDECLNKDIIESLNKEFTTNTNKDNKHLEEIQTNPSVKNTYNNKVLNDRQTIISKSFVKKSESFEEFMNSMKPGTSKSQTETIIPKSDKNNSLSFTNRAGTSSNNNILICQTCPSCGLKVDKPIEIHLNECLKFFNNNFTVPTEKAVEAIVNIKTESNIKLEPGTSKEDKVVQKCPCCGQTLEKSIELHFDECLGFFNNDATMPHEASNIETIVIEDEENDEFDETQTFNSTGTKSPCPCCLEMVEAADMSVHLDVCLVLLKVSSSAASTEIPSAAAKRF